MAGSSDASDLVNEVASRARDAAYVAVGLGVLGLQRAQVQRQELARRAAAMERRLRQLAALRAGLETGSQQLGEWLDATVQFWESSIGPLEEQLPPQARELVGMACSQLGALGTQLRQAVAPRD